MARSCHLRWLPCCLLLVSLPVLCPAAWADAPPPGRELRIFDGSERVIGYHTSSHVGQRELQELMRMVPGGEKIKVRKLASLVRDISDKEKLKYDVHVRRMSNSFKPKFDIAGPDDAEGIAEGVEVLTKAMEADRKLGLKAVFYHAGHYHENTIEPEFRSALLNSGLAYRAMAEKNDDPRYHFIDTIAPTKEHFPATVRKDGFHTSTLANYIEGLKIVQAMCEHDQIAFPEQIEAFVGEKIAEASAKAEVIEVTFPNFDMPTDEPLRVGDTITIRWEADKEKVPGVYVLLHSVFRDDYYISDAIPTDSEEFGEYTWTVKRKLKNAFYGGHPATRPPSKAKWATLTNRRAHKNWYCIRVMTSDMDKVEEIYSFSTRFRIDMDAEPREKPRHFGPRTESCDP